MNKFMKVGSIKTWRELMIGVQQLARLLFNNDFINPGLAFNIFRAEKTCAINSKSGMILKLPKSIVTSLEMGTANF